MFMTISGGAIIMIPAVLSLGKDCHLNCFVCYTSMR